jgi:serine/threonine protein kinase
MTAELGAVSGAGQPGEGPPQGTLGPYELIELLGRGGFGEVMLARGPAGPVGAAVGPAVVKTSMAPQGQQAGHRRFLEEARTLALLDHPGITRLYDVGFDNGRMYIALEFVPGVEVATVMTHLTHRRRPLPVDIAVYIACELLTALDYAHRLKSATTGAPLGLVHRDVSLTNAMVTFDGDVKLIDFGIATSAEHPKLTAAHNLVGTLGYMSPQRVMGAGVDARADVYSLGVVLYECLAGMRFFAGKSRFEILAYLDQQNYQPPWAGIPAPLVPVLRRATAGALEARTPSAAALRDELRALGLYDELTASTHLRTLLANGLPQERERALLRAAKAKAPPSSTTNTAVRSMASLLGSQLTREEHTALDTPGTSAADVSAQSFLKEDTAAEAPLFPPGQSGDSDTDAQTFSVPAPPPPPEVSSPARTPATAPPPPALAKLSVTSTEASPPPLPHDTSTFARPPSDHAQSSTDPPFFDAGRVAADPSTQLVERLRRGETNSFSELKPKLSPRLVAAIFGIAAGLAIVGTVVLVQRLRAHPEVVTVIPPPRPADVVDAGADGAAVVVDAGAAVAVVAVVDTVDAGAVVAVVGTVDAGADAGALVAVVDTVDTVDAGAVDDDDDDVDAVDVDSVVDAGRARPRKRRPPRPPAPAADATVGDLVGYLRTHCVQRVPCARPLLVREKTLNTAAELSAFAGQVEACVRRCR